MQGSGSEGGERRRTRAMHRRGGRDGRIGGERGRRGRGSGLGNAPAEGHNGVMGKGKKTG